MTDHFLISLYKLNFEEETPCMSRGPMDAMSEIKDWFASPDGTYLRVFTNNDSPHILLRHATKNMTMKEVCYHISIEL